MRYPSFLRPLGLSLFLLGFAVFVFVLTLGRFELTPSVVKQTLKPEHQTALQPRLGPLLGKTWQTGAGARAVGRHLWLVYRGV